MKAWPVCSPVSSVQREGDQIEVTAVAYDGASGLPRRVLTRRQPSRHLTATGAAVALGRIQHALLVLHAGAFARVLVSVPFVLGLALAWYGAEVTWRIVGTVVTIALLALGGIGILLSYLSLLIVVGAWVYRVHGTIQDTRLGLAVLAKPILITLFRT